jgi:hypothetical protein
MKHKIRSGLLCVLCQKSDIIMGHRTDCQIDPPRDMKKKTNNLAQTDVILLFLAYFMHFGSYSPFGPNFCPK